MAQTGLQSALFLFSHTKQIEFCTKTEIKDVNLQPQKRTEYYVGKQIYIYKRCTGQQSEKY